MTSTLNSEPAPQAREAVLVPPRGVSPRCGRGRRANGRSSRWSATDSLRGAGRPVRSLRAPPRRPDLGDHTRRIAVVPRDRATGNAPVGER